MTSSPRAARRSADVKAKKDHVPLVNRQSEFPAPYLIAVAVILGVAAAFLVYFAFLAGDRLRELLRR